MKTDMVTDSAVKDRKKTFDLDPETIIDIMERINSLSFEGQCQIIAYLKAQAARRKMDIKIY